MATPESALHLGNLFYLQDALVRCVALCSDLNFYSRRSANVSIPIRIPKGRHDQHFPGRWVIVLYVQRRSPRPATAAANVRYDHERMTQHPIQAQVKEEHDEWPPGADEPFPKPGHEPGSRCTAFGCHGMF